MATWPATLPQAFQRGTFKDAEPNLFARTEMDAGQAKIRRRFTAGPRPISGDMVLTTAQVAILRAFWVSDGASEITLPDPYGGSAITVNFAGEPAYVDFLPNYWKVSLKFAVLPAVPDEEVLPDTVWVSSAGGDYWVSSAGGDYWVSTV